METAIKTGLTVTFVIAAALRTYGIDPYDSYRYNDDLSNDYGVFDNYDLNDFAWGYGPYDYYERHGDREDNGDSYRPDVYGEGDFYENEYGIFDGEDLNGEDERDFEDFDDFNFDDDDDDDVWYGGGYDYYTDDWHEDEDSFTDWYNTLQSFSRPPSGNKLKRGSL